MKTKHQLSIATLLLTGVFATGCSQQTAGGSQQQVGGGSQVSGSQQQVEDAEPVVAQEIMAPKNAQPIMAPKPAVDPWNHAHPEAPACAQTKNHSHQYAKNGAPHNHNYGCLSNAEAEPQVDVRALQLKLQAKGYYKGPINGVIGPDTRNALERFMKR